MKNKYQKYFILSLILTVLTPVLLGLQFICWFLYGWGVGDGMTPSSILEFIVNYGLYFILLYFITCLTCTIAMKIKADKLKRNLSDLTNKI